MPLRVDGKGFAPRELEDFLLYPDAEGSVAALKRGGFEVVVVTNQPDVEAGLVSIKQLDAMHELLRKNVEVDHVRFCPHLVDTGCLCRKPLTGLMDLELSNGDIDFENSWMVGDRDSDIRAGISFGVQTIFIDRNWTVESGYGATLSVSSLFEAATEILARLQTNTEG